MTLTRGQHVAQAVRDHLTLNGLKQSQLTGAVLAEIADRCLDHLDKLAKKKKRLASEEEWLKELESEPHLKGVDVRKELASAQYWTKHRNRVCTRRFFLNWLDKAQRSAVISPGGAAPQLDRKDVYSEPPGWRNSDKARIALKVSTETWLNICTEGWFNISTDLRASILRNL